MKINLGAGRWKLDGRGWTTVDADPRSTPDIIHNLTTTPYPFKDNTASFIYASHIIEHLTYQECRALLSECVRILAPKGIMRIALPDYPTAFQKYIDGEFIEWFNNIMKDDPSWPIKKYATELSALTEEFIYAGSPHPLAHKTVWDQKTIEYFMLKAGFSKAFESEFGHSDYPELRDIDNRQKLSFFVEGQK